MVKGNLDASKLEARQVKIKGFKAYWVKIGMLGKVREMVDSTQDVPEDTYACEVWVGRKKKELKPRAYTIGGIAPFDACEIKQGEDLYTKVNLLLDPQKKIKGVLWK